MDDGTIKMLKKTFSSADKSKSGFVNTSEMESILTELGTDFNEEQLQDVINEVDQAKEGKVNFEGFLSIITTFLEEDDEDDAVIMEELQEAFRLYDKEGIGFISTKVLKEMLRELDNQITEEDLNDIIGDIDEDNKGKIDFEHFKMLML